ncbi:MAG: DUF342 domain-containing protein, partial [Fibrobacteria bacterium]|nr:DUF342 domain-containing protein [Fibrobacteria bacterium]
MDSTKPKILVVDDETDLLRVLDKILTSLDYEVECLDNGPAALKSVLATFPDLVVLDVNMPEMSGLEVCKQIKENPLTRHIAVILFTAKGDVETKVSGLDYGADDYLVKGADIAEIKARIRSQLRLKQTRDELRKSNSQLAVANKRIKDELEVARRVQEGIYPKTIPNVDGFELAFKLVQARQVGGDYYDVIPLSDHEIALLIVDVSGHDISSAFIVGMAKMSFSLHIRENCNLADVFRSVNNDMVSAIKTDHHLTAFLAIINTRTQLLRYAKAGHFEQYIYRDRKKEIEVLATEGMVIGTFEDGGFEEKSCMLGPGDKLVMYTDGLIENTNPKQEQFGKERLFRLIQKGGHLPTEKFHQLLLDEQNEFCKSQRPHDDFCLMVSGLQGNPVSVGTDLKPESDVRQPASMILSDKTATKKGVAELLAQLETKQYSDALIIHYQKALHLLTSGFWLEPGSENCELKISALIEEKIFKLILTIESSNWEKVDFFTSEACRNILIHFNAAFGDIEINESGDRLIFNYEKGKITKPEEQNVKWVYKTDGTYLVVPPTISPLVTFNSIRSGLLAKNVTNANYDLIKKTLIRKTGRAVKVGPPFTFFDNEKYKNIKFSANPLEAHLTLVASQKDDKKLSLEDLGFLLARNNVCFGIKQEVLSGIADNPQPARRYLIAEAKSAVNGKNAEIIECVKIDTNLTPLEQNDGTVDYKKLDLFSAVEENTVILERKPPTPGVAGTSIFGRTLDPIPGEDKLLKAGENTAIVKGGTQLISLTSGYLYKNHKGIHVREVFYVKNNVDYATGNIN